MIPPEGAGGAVKGIQGGGWKSPAGRVEDTRMQVEPAQPGFELTLADIQRRAEPIAGLHESGGVGRPRLIELTLGATDRLLSRRLDRGQLPAGRRPYLVLDPFRFTYLGEN